ncbi:MAG: hypothetical protein F4039_06090 [Gammaproteobacteria bacterium]|nr:hypothetical protein [Gammaproteobacteria bacterium]MXX94823.1 hypothetical protein [Gammaproteobacteria bacterium]MYF52669.1 hypothetical protein [Gammaproteobacteria bacterium]MYK43636.1 hypothetical protein [Gammaproteobacteria bacterium]
MNDKSQDEYPYTKKLKKEFRDLVEDTLRIADATWFKLTVYSVLFVVLGLVVFVICLQLFG